MDRGYYLIMLSCVNRTGRLIHRAQSRSRRLARPLGIAASALVELLCHVRQGSPDDGNFSRQQPGKDPRADSHESKDTSPLRIVRPESDDSMILRFPCLGGHGEECSRPASGDVA